MSVEERLRRTLADEVLVLPAWPDPVGRVSAGITRRRRLRRLFGAVSTAVLAVLTAGVWTAVVAPAGPRPAPSPSAAIVPWKDSPIGAVDLFPPPSPRPSARPCGAADLATSVKVTDNGAAGGHRFIDVTIRNTSGSRCTLSGSAQLTATDARTGARGRLTTRSGTGYGGTGYETPATIDPDEEATLGLVTGNGCNGGANPTTYRDIAVVMLGRSYPLGTLTVQTTCELEVTDWMLDIQTRPLTPPPYARLVPTLDVPATVRIGQWFDFTVTLTNPTGAAVAVVPCPAYRMTVFKGGGSYWLNCPGTPVPAHGAVRFAMRLQVAGSTPPGLVHLQWQLLDQPGVSPVADAVLRATT
jgi:hypothetical protein